MEQIERIRQMEMRLDQAEEAVKELSVALEKYVVAQDAIRTIEAYYGSEEWCLSLKKVDSLNLKQWVVTFFKGKSI
jgi:hypothetical protein